MVMHGFPRVQAHRSRWCDQIDQFRKRNNNGGGAGVVPGGRERVSGGTASKRNARRFGGQRGGAGVAHVGPERVGGGTVLNGSRVASANKAAERVSFPVGANASVEVV